MRKYLKIAYWLIVSMALVTSAVEAYRQVGEDRYIDDLAGRIVSKAGARSPREKVIALREHIIHNVRYQGAQYYNRPVFRATAAETLQSGLGYCGEVTRAFINLALAEGIRAQRINLWGKDPHVVAEAEIEPGKFVIADCQNPPKVKDLVSLDEAISQPQFDDFYTFNLRRMRLEGVVTRLRTETWTLIYWLENPHALMATIWGGIAALMIISWLVVTISRRLLRSKLIRGPDTVENADITNM